MPRNRGWFRVYDRMIDSPQIVELNDSEFRLLVSMWCLASAHGSEQGLVPYTVTGLRRRCLPDHTDESMKQMLDHLVALDLIAPDDQGFIIQRWAKHQYQYDSWTPEAQRQRRASSSEDQATIKESSSNDQAQTKTDTESDTDTDAEKDISLPAVAPDATEAEREILNVLKGVPQYKFDYKRDLEHIRSLAVDYPAVDLLSEAKKWRAWRLDNPKKGYKNPRLAFRNWCEIAEKRLQERRMNGATPRQHPAKPEPKRSSPYDVLLKPRAGNGARSDGGRGPPA